MLKKWTFLLFVISFSSCSKTQESNSPTVEAREFAIADSEIVKRGMPIQLKGVNSFNSFGPSDYDLMEDWNVKIVREFIGNLRQMPVAGDAVQGDDGKWLHSMQTLVEGNRDKGMVTILCPFGWVDSQGELTLFTGLNPSEQSFYSAYKEKMRAIADHFKDQEDVWVEIWNEPYSWQNANGYNHDLWLKDAEEMVDNLRSVEGFDNIILVAGNEQGQGDEAILEKGNALIDGRVNILFDLHAYGKWHKNASIESIKSRIERIQNLGLAVLFGEVGVITEGATLDDPANFLQAADELDVSTLAWVWLKRSSEQGALLTEDEEPNNNNNNNWGRQFKAFLEY